MWMTKAQSILLAEKLGALETLGLSHTCYHGQNPPCGNCAACQLRAKGFAEAGITDPLKTRACEFKINP
jgi:7-cyano-7-deazaguanine synthase